MIPVILSGGSGTRLWPLSRTKTPKQFCHFFDQTLQEKTIRRLSSIGQTWIVTNRDLKDQTLLQMRNLGLPLEHLVLEPFAKNTAPAVALISYLLSLRGIGPETIGIFPADQLIAQEKSFLAALKTAEAAALSGKVVTLGIRPHAPATGFGYIQVQAEGGKHSNFAHPVERFHEKPDLPTAKKFLLSGDHFWNAGIFVFQVSKMCELFAKHQPQMWAQIQKIKADLSNLESVYKDIQSISVDYAVIEKLGPEELSCVPCDMGWDDVGSWDAIAEIKGKFEESQAITVEAENNFVHPIPNKSYSFAGVDDLIVVDTKDALMITRKGQSQKVKQVVDQVKIKTPILTMQHQDEERPWGGFEVLKDTEIFKSKVVMINPGQQISYQSHDKREEHWLIVQGFGEVILDDKVVPVQPGTYVKIPVKAKHRIRNTGEGLMQFVEVQLGSYFGEDDIVRYQDDYLRN